MRRPRLQFRMAVLTAATLLAGVAAGAQALANSNKIITNPEEGMSDAQREAMHQAAHDRNAAFLASFVASHTDPHTLGVVEVPTYGGTDPTSLPEALAMSSAVVEANVESVTYESSSSGGMPTSFARISVLKTLRGQAPATTTVVQSGGPVAQGSGGALAEFDVDPLILPNDHAYLMLRAVPGVTGFATVPAAGVIEIGTDGIVHVSDHNPLGSAIEGKPASVVAALLAG